jgi:hypothetical protein
VQWQGPVSVWQKHCQGRTQTLCAATPAGLGASRQPPQQRRGAGRSRCGRSLFGLHKLSRAATGGVWDAAEQEKGRRGECVLLLRRREQDLLNQNRACKESSRAGLQEYAHIHTRSTGTLHGSRAGWRLNEVVTHLPG